VNSYFYLSGSHSFYFVRKSSILAQVGAYSLPIEEMAGKPASEYRQRLTSVVSFRRRSIISQATQVNIATIRESEGHEPRGRQ